MVYTCSSYAESLTWIISNTNYGRLTVTFVPGDLVERVKSAMLGPAIAILLNDTAMHMLSHLVIPFDPEWNETTVQCENWLGDATLLYTIAGIWFNNNLSYIYYIYSHYMCMHDRNGVYIFMLCNLNNIMYENQGIKIAISVTYMLTSSIISLYYAPLMYRIYYALRVGYF